MTRKSAAVIILLACAVAGTFLLVRVQLPAFRLPKNNTLKSYMGVQACPSPSNSRHCPTPAPPEPTPNSNPSNPNSPEESGPNLHATQTAEMKELIETLQVLVNTTNTPEAIPPTETPSVEYVQTPTFTITAEPPGEPPTTAANAGPGSASLVPFVLLAAIITIAIFLAAYLFRRFEG